MPASRASVIVLAFRIAALKYHALGTAEHDLSADMGNSVVVLRSHYINRLVSRREAAKCWRVLDAVSSRFPRS